MPVIAHREWRGRDIVGASPNFYLRLAVLGGGFRLVQPLKSPVVTFVQSPAALHRNPELAELVQRDPAGTNRTGQQAGERLIEGEALLPEQMTGGERFL